MTIPTVQADCNWTIIKEVTGLYMFDMFDIHSCLFKAFICSVNNR